MSNTEKRSLRRNARAMRKQGEPVPGETVLVRRILGTGQEQLLSADEASLVTLDYLQPRVAQALESNLVVTIRGGFWLRAKVDHGRLHARVWHSNQPQGTAQIAMTVSRSGPEGIPVLEVCLAGMRATADGHDMSLDLSDLVQRLAWCWLLRFVD